MADPVKKHEVEAIRKVSILLYINPHFLPNMSLRFSAFIFPLLLVSVNSVFSPPKLIKLAFGVSQATSNTGKLTNRFGQIMRNAKDIACRVGGWQATRRHFPKIDETVVIFKHHKRLLAVIGFRESNSLTDWIHNFNVFQREISIGRGRYRIRIHGGYLLRYRHIQQWFENTYTHLRRDHYKIIITGYSLGGAMAKISSTFAAGNLGSPPDAVITFAAPKVGNGAFKKYYERAIGCDKTVKIEVPCDPIVKLPLWGYARVCSAVTVKRWWIKELISCHLLTGHYRKGLQARYGVHLQYAAQACDQ